jgi:UDP-glucose 4-epimerase
MTNVLITGSAGFIGSHLMKSLLADGHNVVGIDNMSHPCGNKVKTEYCDVRYQRDLLPYFQECDIVYHLAAQINVDKSIVNPEETIATNIIGTQNVLELARRARARIVFASTSEIYGSSQTDMMPESHPLDCQSPYGASKVAADRLCQAYYKTFGLDVVIVRNFNTFGEYQNDDSYGGVIAKFTKAALSGEPLFIFGSGNQERDYMYIDDAIQAYRLITKAPRGSVINFGSGKTVRVIDIALKILEITGSMSTIVMTGERPGEVQRLCADISKARELGFSPKTDFSRDLEKYIAWYKRNK